jgi:hypothetical protein
MENFQEIVGLNKLPKLPYWGIHRQSIVAVDAAAPTLFTQGVNPIGFQDVWLDLAFRGGTKTATIKLFFWSPAATVTLDGDGNPVYTGGWVAQTEIADIAVVGGDGGHKQVKLTVDQRAFALQVTVLGAGTELHMLVAGGVSIDA